MKRRIIQKEECCSGCFACQVACLDQRYEADADPVITYRTVKTIRNTEEQFQKQVCVGCTHCGACITVCPTQALYREEETGLVLADASKCNGCRACLNICKNDAIRYDDQGKVRKCDGCRARISKGKLPACVKACALHALELISCE